MPVDGEGGEAAWECGGENEESSSQALSQSLSSSSLESVISSGGSLSSASSSEEAAGSASRLEGRDGTSLEQQDDAQEWWRLGSEGSLASPPG